MLTTSPPIDSRKAASDQPPRAGKLTIFIPHASDLLTDHQPHGDGLVAFEVVFRLAQRGHVVHAAAPRIDVRTPLPPSLHLYELSVPDEASVRDRVRYMVRLRRLFGELSRTSPPDVIHQLNPVFTGISLALFGTRIPIVLGSFVGDWPDDADPLPTSRAAGRPLMQRAKRFAASLQQRSAAKLLVTTPAAAASRIVDHQRDGAKIVVVPHGIDADRYEPSYRSTADAPTIFYLGGIEYRKGIFTLLEAFRSVRAAVPACRLTIAGWGRETPRLEAQVAGLPERDAISVLGKVPRTAIGPLMRESTVFCNPAFGEPFGMAILEAMACGKPLVVTDAGGPAYIADDEGARKVRPGDPEALAQALIDVLTSPDLQERMGAHNRARVEALYAWDPVVERIEAAYFSVVQRRTV